MNINVQNLLIKKLQSTNNKLLDAVQTFDENLSSSNTTQDVSSEVFNNVINLVEKQDHLMQYIEQDGGANADPLETAITDVKKAATNAKQAFQKNQKTIQDKESEINRLNEQIKSLESEAKIFAKNSTERETLKLQIGSVNEEKTKLTKQIDDLQKQNVELQKQKKALESAKETTIKQLNEVLEIMKVFLPTKP